MLAQVAVSKYSDHLPLHRQEKIFRRTMTDFITRSLASSAEQFVEDLQ